MNTDFSSYETIHATALIIGESGVLIRGKSGSGKTALALKLIDEAKNRGMFSRLVCDDRVRLFATRTHLIATAHPNIKGKIEIRGMGIVSIDYEKSCILKLVIDLKEILLRMPDVIDGLTEIAGLNLPCIHVVSDNPSISGIFYYLKSFDLRTC